MHCVGRSSLLWTLRFQRFFFTFFSPVFLAVFESTNGCGAFVWKLRHRVSKRDGSSGGSDESVSASRLRLLILSGRVRRDELQFPPLKTLDSFKAGTIVATTKNQQEKKSGESHGDGSQDYTLFQIWRLKLTTKEEKKKGKIQSVLERKQDVVFKKKSLFSSFTLILERK